MTVAKVLGYLWWPVAFLLGVPASECAAVGELLGTKLALNEFVAYADLGKQLAAGELSERTGTVATYALCGFANFGSCGLMIGALSGIVPGLRAPMSRDIARALAAGTLACLSRALVASALYHEGD